MTEPIKVRYSFSTTAKVLLTLAALVIIGPPVMVATFLIDSSNDVNVNAEQQAGNPPHDWYTLPSCIEDSPDPMTSPNCVWNDEDKYIVVTHGSLVEAEYSACKTEDSYNCVWDSMEQGNRNGEDNADRFVINGGPR
jgi:hypothetical protein